MTWNGKHTVNIYMICVSCQLCWSFVSNDGCEVGCYELWDSISFFLFIKDAPVYPLLKWEINEALKDLPWVSREFDPALIKAATQILPGPWPFIQNLWLYFTREHEKVDLENNLSRELVVVSHQTYRCSIQWHKYSNRKPAQATVLLCFDVWARLGMEGYKCSLA